ncbi:MAG: hypothetical protein ACODAJ_04420 [Planctomycetota bacterium]
MPWPVWKLGLVVAVVAVTSCLIVSPAGAGSDRSAIVVGKGGAALLDGNGDIAYATDFHKVITRSRNGNAILKLRAKDVPNDTGKAVHWSYANTRMTCGVYVTGRGVVAASNWRETVSADGNAVLTCLVKLPKKDKMK